MKKREKIVLIICTIFLILAILLLIFKKDKDDIEDININKSLTEVTNKQEFFEVNMNINNFYDYLTMKQNKLVSIINPDYLDNISNLTSKEYGTVSYFAKKIYSFKYNDISYYFINGEFVNRLDELQLEKDINLFMIVDNARVTYNIMPIDKYSITIFFDNYDIDPNYKINLNDGNMYNKHEFINEEYAMHYINYFRYLLLIEPKEVYNNYIDYNYKITFKNYNDFYNKRVDIANDIPLISDMFREESYDGYLAYVLELGDGSYVILKEYSLMDFKIIYHKK